MRQSSWRELNSLIRENYRRTKLGSFPTPVQRLSLPLAEGPELWVKRDDLSSRVYGGNKTRKLEFILRESERPVLTFGPLGSHHVLSTALHAKAMGKRCAAILVPQHMTLHHREIYEGIVSHCDPIFELTFHPRGAEALMRAVATVLAPGDERYELCPPGGTSPHGTLGYVLGGFELIADIEAGVLPEPKQVFVPLGTGGTAVGLAIAFAIAGMKTQTVAVRVVPRLALPEFALSLLARRTLRLLAKLGASLARNRELRLRVENQYSTSYAVPSEAGLKAVAVGERIGVALESTYSAKTFAAFLAQSSSSGSDAGPLLFWQTFSSELGFSTDSEDS